MLKRRLVKLKERDRVKDSEYYVSPCFIYAELWFQMNSGHHLSTVQPNLEVPETSTHSNALMDMVRSKALGPKPAFLLQSARMNCIVGFMFTSCCCMDSGGESASQSESTLLFTSSSASGRFLLSAPSFTTFDLKLSCDLLWHQCFSLLCSVIRFGFPAVVAFLALLNVHSWSLLDRSRRKLQLEIRVWELESHATSFSTLPLTWHILVPPRNNSQQLSQNLCGVLELTRHKISERCSGNVWPPSGVVWDGAIQHGIT